MKCDSIYLKNLTLQKVIRVFFLLIILASFTVAVLITYSFNEKHLKQQLFGNPSGPLSLHNPSDGFQERISIFYHRFQQRMILTVGIFLFGMAALFFVMIRVITSRLDNIAQGTQKMCLGQLNVSIPVQAPDEIGKIGDRKSVV